MRPSPSSGYAGASLRRIASAAHATTGAIYNHFGSKEGLFDALVGESAERLVSAWAAGRTGSDSGGPGPATGPGGGRGETAPGSDGGAADSEALAHSVGRTNDLLALIYDDLDIFELLLCHATGSRYEHFPERRGPLRGGRSEWLCRCGTAEE